MSSVSEWIGDPVYRQPVRCGDGSYSVFHRDIQGKIVAKFFGNNARVMAKRFCELFGEPDGSTIQQPNGDSGQ